MNIAKKYAQKNFDGVARASSREWRHGLSPALRRSRRIVRKAADRFEAKMHWRSFADEECQAVRDEAAEAAKSAAFDAKYPSFYDLCRDDVFDDFSFNEDDVCDDVYDNFHTDRVEQPSSVEEGSFYDEYDSDAFYRYAFPEMFRRRSA